MKKGPADAHDAGHACRLLLSKSQDAQNADRACRLLSRKGQLILMMLPVLASSAKKWDSVCRLPYRRVQLALMMLAVFAGFRMQHHEHHLVFISQQPLNGSAFRACRSLVTCVFRISLSKGLGPIHDFQL